MATDDPPKKRGRGRPKGTPASAKQKATNVGARKAAAEAKARRAAERKKLAVPEKQRWKQLEDGDISIKDLTLDELVRGEVANNDGSWEGRRHQLNSRMLGRMGTEYKRRIRNGISKLAPLALEALEELLEDADSPAQRASMVKMVLEYEVGKVPDVVHVGAENEWDRLQQSGFRIIRGEAAVTVEDQEHDVVPGLVVREEQEDVQSRIV